MFGKVDWNMCISSWNDGPHWRRYCSRGVTTKESCRYVMAKTLGMAQQSYPKSWRTLKNNFADIHVSGQIVTTSLRPKPGIMVNKENHSKIAQHFRLVKYCNSTRCIIRFFRSLPKWLICLPMVFLSTATPFWAIFAVFQISFHQRFWKSQLFGRLKQDESPNPIFPHDFWWFSIS